MKRSLLQSQEAPKLRSWSVMESPYLQQQTWTASGALQSVSSYGGSSSAQLCMCRDAHNRMHRSRCTGSSRRGCAGLWAHCLPRPTASMVDECVLCCWHTGSCMPAVCLLALGRMHNVTA